MAKSIDSASQESERERLIIDVLGCLFDIEHNIDLIWDHIDEAKTYLSELSK